MPPYGANDVTNDSKFITHNALCSFFSGIPLTLFSMWVKEENKKFSFLCDTARSCCSAAVDRYLLPAGPTVADPPHAAATFDRRTDTVPLHIPCRILHKQCQEYDDQQRASPVFCDLRAAHSAGSMSHGNPAAEAISFTIYTQQQHQQSAAVSPSRTIID